MKRRKKQLWKKNGWSKKSGVERRRGWKVKGLKTQGRTKHVHPTSGKREGKSTGRGAS